MNYQGEGEGEGEDGREKAWLVGRKVDMSGQAEQEFGRALGEKVEREFGRKMGGWEVEREVTGKIGRW